MQTRAHQRYLFDALFPHSHIVALSGGKDSTVMAIELARREPRDYTYLCTPTGNELPDFSQYIDRLAGILGKPILRITNGTLDSWINEWGALPNHRQRWCTRALKIEPCLAYLRANQPSTLYVGLRADEELREGIYSSDVDCDFPLRRFGFGISEVLTIIRRHGIKLPQRGGNCALCFGQRIAEWKKLLREHPDLYAQGERYEAMTGKTFRSPSRDTWPAPLVQLRAEFEGGRKIRGGEETPDHAACRVCSI